MAIKRISDLEQFPYVLQPAFLSSDELKYSCMEVSRNVNDSERSQFQSTRIDLYELSGYINYDIINSDITFNGTKTFTNQIIGQNGINITGANPSTIRSTGNVVVQGQNIQLSCANTLSTLANILSTKATTTTLSTSSLSVVASNSTNINTKSATISSTTDIQLKTNKLSTYSLRTLIGIPASGNDRLSVVAGSNNVLLSVNGAGNFCFKNAIQGVAMSAMWADVAEYYISDFDYEPGTLVKFGGEQEITIADTEVNAVITTKPGFILNTGRISSEAPICAIALVGRTPVKVLGPVKKFDKLYLVKPGVAGTLDTCKKYNVESNVVIAKALETKEQNIQTTSLIESVVKLSL